MKHLNNIHQFFDGELSEEEQAILKDAMETNPSLASELREIDGMATLHRESFPSPKNELFIEQEMLAIQAAIEAETNTISEIKATGSTIDSSNHTIRFPTSPWVRSMIGLAAAITLTVTGAWVWIQSSATGTIRKGPAIEFVETDIAGASSMIFLDEQSGWTIVWVDEPIETS